MDLRFMVCDLRWKNAGGSPGSSLPLSLACCLLALILLGGSGCETPPKTVTPSSQPTPGEKRQAVEPVSAAVPSGFGPVKISILPLSEIAGPPGVGQDARLSVYVALLDAFGCPIKAPCVLRFEVYEHVPRSAQIKGQRLMIWPDIDLTHPADNNKSWRDFLRAYEVQLDLRAERDRTYILQTTCLGPDGKRLSGEYPLRIGQ